MYGKGKATALYAFLEGVDGEIMEDFLKDVTFVLDFQGWIGIDGVQGRLLWDMDYFELKAIKTQQTQGNFLPLFTAWKNLNQGLLERELSAEITF